MKPLLLWGAAALVASYFVVRYRRGAKRRLVGKYSSQFVHAVSVLLVAVGCGGPAQEVATPPPEEQDPHPDTTKSALEPSLEESSDVVVPKPLEAPWQDMFPHVLDERQLATWLSLQDKSGAWAYFKQASIVPGSGSVARNSLSDEMKASLAALDGDADTSSSVAELQAALVEMENRGLFDTWLAGYVYRAAISLPVSRGTSDLYSAIESHNRVAESFIVALAHSKLKTPRPWMSKAAPPSGYSHHLTLDDPEAFLREAETRYQGQDSGTWNTQGRVAMTLLSGVAILRRRNTEIPIDTNTRTFYLRRLDVLASKGPLKLQVPYLGTIDIPAGTFITSTSIREHLSPGGSRLLQMYIQKVLAGDSEATAKLTRLLPIAAKELQAAIDQKPNAIGAPTARTLLFDTNW